MLGLELRYRKEYYKAQLNKSYSRCYIDINRTVSKSTLWFIKLQKRLTY